MAVTVGFLSLFCSLLRYCSLCAGLVCLLATLSLLHDLLGWLGFCLCFRQTKIEKFSTNKQIVQLGGVGVGGCCLRSSDVYTKSRGFAFCLLLLVLGALLVISVLSVCVLGVRVCVCCFLCVFGGILLFTYVVVIFFEWGLLLFCWES